MYSGWNLILIWGLNKHGYTVTVKVLRGNLLESDSRK